MSPDKPANNVVFIFMSGAKGMPDTKPCPGLESITWKLWYHEGMIPPRWERVLRLRGSVFHGTCPECPLDVRLS
jgi:hypothetical protein